MSGPETLPRLLAERARSAPRSRVALRKRHGMWERTTAAELADRVVAIAEALRRAGVCRGTPVLVMGDATLEWLAADLAVQTAGGVSVGAYPTQALSELEAMLGGARAPIVFCDDEAQAAALAELRGVEAIVVLDPRYDLVPPADPRVRTLAAFSADAAPLDGAGAWLALTDRLTGDDDAVGSVTAGRTAPPRVAVLHHAAVLGAARAAAGRFALTARDTTLAHVPPAQTRLLDLYAPLLAGATLGFCESGRTVEADLQELRPSVVITVARALELLKARVDAREAGDGRFKRAVTRWAAAGRSAASSRNLLARLLVDRFVAAHLGLGRTRTLIVCGVPPAAVLQGFFTGIGVPVHTVYGQAESLGLTATRPAAATGTTATPVDGVRVSVAGGELHLDGAWVARRFLDGVPCATEHGVPTGDLGRLDGDGRLMVDGAAHDIVRRPGGEEVALTRVEAQLNASPYVHRAIAVALSDGGLGGLVEIERAAVAAWAAARGLTIADYAGLARAPEVVALVEELRVHANAALADHERLEAIAVLPRPLHADAVTPTFAVRRAAVLEAHGALVARLGAPAVVS
jgi:long-chain acyl-CoA synthetase